MSGTGRDRLRDFLDAVLTGTGEGRRAKLDAIRNLLVLAKGPADADYRAERLRQTTLLSWHGPEASIATVLENHV